MLAEYQFLLPIQRDSNRASHGEGLFDWLENRLLSLAGGFSTGASVVGFWRDDSGQVIHDTSIPYTVAIDPDRFGDLIELLAIDVCREFDQQCIYLRFPDGSVELIDRLASGDHVSAGY